MARVREVVDREAVVRGEFVGLRDHAVLELRGHGPVLAEAQIGAREAAAGGRSARRPVRVRRHRLIGLHSLQHLQKLRVRVVRADHLLEGRQFTAVGGTPVEAQHPQFLRVADLVQRVEGVLPLREDAQSIRDGMVRLGQKAAM